MTASAFRGKLKLSRAKSRILNKASHIPVA
jgi:hypothetical protein